MPRFESPFTQREPTFGLALGGGAVFGIAHLGALKALEEHGLRPTHITGTSIGAIMASLYAFGHTPEAIRDACSGLDWWHLSSFSWSKYGIMNNSAMGDFVRRHIGDRDFSEAPYPMAFIATDLASRTKVVLNEGDLAEADYVLALDLADYDRTDPTQSDALFQEGYDACRNAIGAIKQQLDGKAPGLLGSVRRRLLRSAPWLQAGSSGA